MHEVQVYYVRARSKLQQFLDDGCTEQTTPNLLQFVEEVRRGKVDEEMIPKLKPAIDTPANRSARLGDLLRVFLSITAKPFVESIIAGLDHYFEIANFPTLELLERLVFPRVLRIHSLQVITDFNKVIKDGKLLAEDVGELKAWNDDVNELSKLLNMSVILVQGLKAERKQWRECLVVIQQGLVKRGLPLMTTTRSISNEVQKHGNVECPQTKRMLDVFNALLLTSVSPERGFPG
jgi:hypothetical protein